MAPSTGALVGEEVIISIYGLTSNGAFTETVRVDDDSVTYNLKADPDGNFKDTLIPETPGTYTVTVVDLATEATAEVSFEVEAAS